jgi:hypothetical protein
MSKDGSGDAPPQAIKLGAPITIRLAGAVAALGRNQFQRRTTIKLHSEIGVCNHAITTGGAEKTAIAAPIASGTTQLRAANIALFVPTSQV